MMLLLIVVGLALGISFLCSLSESCILSLSLADIAAIAERHPRRGAILRRLKEEIRRPIAAILILNNLANIMGAAVSGAVFAGLFGHKWLGVFSVVFSLVVIQWAEYLPKTLGVHYNRFVALWVARPLSGVVRVLGPLVNALEWFNRPFRGRPGGPAQAGLLGELTVLTRYAAVQNLLSREQTDIVLRSLKLSQARVEDIMVEREDVKTLSTAMSLADALIESHIHHHTRYLLIQGANLDNVVGYVNVKDIVSALQLNPTNPSLAGIARPVLQVDAALRVPDLLKMMTRGYQHMAVVRRGERTVGLVTIEDVVEAIVGDLEDEYDVLPIYCYPMSEQRYLAGGGLSLQALRQKTRFDVPDLPTSLHEWLCGLRGGLPRIENTIAVGGIAFTVRKIRRAKIHEVIVDARGPIRVAAPPAGVDAAAAGPETRDRGAAGRTSPREETDDRPG